MEATGDRLTYDVETAARLLGIGRSAAYEAVHTGQIPSIRIGSRILIPRVQLSRLLLETQGGQRDGDETQ